MFFAVCMTTSTVGLTVADVAQEFRLTGLAVGVLAAAPWAGAGIASGCAAPKADAGGWRRAASVGLALSLLGQGGLAVAAWSTPALVACLVLARFGYGMVTPTTNVVIVSEVPRRRRGLAVGVKQSAPPLAGFATGAVVPWAVHAGGWRAAYGLLSAVGLVVLLLVVAVGAVTARSGAPVDAAPAGSSALANRYARRGLVLWIGALAALPVGVLLGFSATALQDAGLSLVAAGAVLSVASIGSLVVRVAGGWLSDRRGADSLLGASSLIALGSVGLVLVGTGHLPLVVAGVMLGYACAWGWPALMILGLMAQAGRAVGSVTGLLALGAAVGAGVGPVLFGAVADAAGAAVAWWCVAVGALPGSALALGLRTADEGG